MNLDRENMIKSQQAQQATAVMDEGLRAYMLKVYNYMATGILLTGIVSLITFKMAVVSVSSTGIVLTGFGNAIYNSACLLYTSPSPRDPKTSRMPSSA